MIIHCDNCGTKVRSTWDGACIVCGTPYDGVPDGPKPQSQAEEEAPEAVGS